MLSKIKTGAIALLSIALTMVTALFAKQKIANERQRREVVERRAELERNANQAMVESLGQESSIRDHYENTSVVERTDLD